MRKSLKNYIITSSPQKELHNNIRKKISNHLEILSNGFNILGTRSDTAVDVVESVILSMDENGLLDASSL